MIIEGPSGIGKTTSIIKAQEEMKLGSNILQLSARVKEDLEYISQIPSGAFSDATIIVDDFHRLTESLKQNIADYMKALADNDTNNVKLILIGINDAGESLIKFASDLNNRVDTIKFEKNPDHKVLELIESGEKALNITISIKQDIVELAQGSFHIAQMLCKETCILDDTTEQQEQHKIISVSESLVKDYVLNELGRHFYEPARIFSTGPKLRPEGRSPYLHLLKWLAESDSWSIRMNDAMNAHPEMKGSINQVVEKKFLDKFISENDTVQSVIHYDSISKILSIEDPKFLFYIKYIAWNKFAK